jgi:hypothetical protein
MSIRSSALVVLAGLAFAPIAWAQSKAATAAVDSVGAVIKEMTKGREQVQAALDALDVLHTEGANLRKQYASFSKNVDAMAKTKDRVVARIDDMGARRDAYLQDWQKKIKGVSSPEIQAHMEARRAEVERILDSSRPAREAARDAFLPFLANLQDVDKLLSLDLSPAGVEAAASFTESAVASGKSVLTALDAFLGSLEAVEQQISPRRK